MPLAKKLSKLFRHEKGEKDSVVTTIRPVDPNPLSPVYEAEAAPATTTTQDDDYIIAATQASLEDEISRLEAHVQNQTNQLSRQEHANSRARQEISSLNERLASASAENSTLRASTENVRVMLSELVNESSRLRVELQAKANELGTEREEKARLQRENSALQVDMKALYDNLQSFENTKPQIMAMFNEQARKSRDLEQRLSYALQPMNDDARRTFEERIAWVNERAELENRFQAEKSEMTKQIDTLRRHVDMKEEQCVRVEARASAVQARLEEQEAAVAAITADLEEERAMHRDAKEIIQALQVSEQNMHEEFSQTQSRLTQLLSMFGTDPTPRQVLYLEHHVKKFPRARGEATVGDNTVFSRTHVFEDLTTNDLNAPLSETDFATFIQSAITSSTNDNGPRRIGFKRCHECHRHKIIALSNQSSPNLGEFPKEYAREYRCSSSICKECLLNKLKSSITQDWWYNLDSDQWLKCPIAGCDHALNIRLTEELPDLLDDYTLREIAEVKQVYAYSVALRGALARIEPQISMEGILTAIELYKQLSAFGIFRSTISTAAPDEYDPEEPLDVGEVLVGSLDRDNLKIPIFTKFFKRSETAKDCSICLESFHEIDIESEQQWKDVCDGYHGDWMSQVFSFPSNNILQCDEHNDSEVCKDCFGRHLESQLEQHGWNSRGRLTCPICNRALSEDEIRRLASKETVQKYDHYLLLSHLSSDPNFRRCLRAGCEDGQIYEQDEYPNPHIICNTCDFEMCFTHQIPWHAGLSCDQYESQREHGDPDYQQTREWMQSNSKNCPGANCGVNIEKGNACFHMTCTQCRHEFCWECLADWSRINPRPGTYVKEAHNDGCWFRESDLEPTQISGTDLQGALRRRGVL